jgi:hypothetical protein
MDISRFASTEQLILQLNAYHANVGISQVRYRMRCERSGPNGGARLWFCFGGTRIVNNIALSILSHKIAKADNV